MAEEKAGGIERLEEDMASLVLQCSQYLVLSSVAGRAKWYFRSKRLGRLEIPASSLSTISENWSAYYAVLAEDIYSNLSTPDIHKCRVNTNSLPNQVYLFLESMVSI